MPPNDDGYDDRPKKSWKEIDAARDGKRSRSSSPPGERAKLEKSGQYSRYKSAADQFFSGNLLPDALREKLDPTGEGKARQDLLKKVKDAEDFKVFAQLSKEYVDKYDLPDEDPYLLDRLLGHPNEGLVLKTLEKLTEKLKAGELKPPKSLEQRLKSLQLGSDSPDIQDGAKALGILLKNAPR
jgi:hypothetical protein